MDEEFNAKVKAASGMAMINKWRKVYNILPRQYQEELFKTVLDKKYAGKPEEQANAVNELFNNMPAEVMARVNAVLKHG